MIPTHEIELKRFTKRKLAGGSEVYRVLIKPRSDGHRVVYIEADKSNGNQVNLCYFRYGDLQPMIDALEAAKRVFDK